MAGKVRAIPEGFGTLTPHLVVRGAAKAIDFYKKAFGAEEVMRMPTPDGQYIIHATVKIGDSMLMLCDEMPQMQRWVSPAALNGTTVALHLHVEDVDKAFQRAVDAGCKVSFPLMDMFWGDRYGKLTDPFGHEWSMATKVKDVTPQEAAAGAQAFFAGIGKPEAPKK